MTRIAVAYITTAIIFAALDFLWLSKMGSALYRPIIGEIMAPEPRMAPAVLFYLIFIAGLVYFAVLPGLAAGSWQVALVKGAALGFVAYATYDLTNQATLSVWSSKITLFDLAWGTFVSGVGAASGCAITRLIVKG